MTERVGHLVIECIALQDMKLAQPVQCRIDLFRRLVGQVDNQVAIELEWETRWVQSQLASQQR